MTTYDANSENINSETITGISSSEDDNLILSDEEIAEAPSPIIIEDKSFEFLKPPFMLFEDQAQAKRKLREAFTQKEFLLIHGYSGVGKTTILMQFAEKYPDYVLYFDDFSSMGATDLIATVGERINLPLKKRLSEVKTLEHALKHNRNIMLIFDEVNIDKKKSTFQKIDILRKINEHTGIPICICGTQKLYAELHDESRYDDYCSLLTRLDEHEMKGMRSSDANAYLDMLVKEENVLFTWQAKQALVPIALNRKLGGISSFVKIIGRSITHARAAYYTTDGRTIPEGAQCFRNEYKEGTVYPGANISYTLPITPDRLVIDEYLVSMLLADFKSQCKPIKKKK